VIVFNNNKSVISRFIAKSGHQYSFGEKVQTEVTAEMNYIDAGIEEYTGNPSEYRFDVFGGVVIRAARGLNVSINLRQPFVTGFTAPTLPYAGAEYQILTGKHQLKWTVNGSRNYRIPTFNDRYWQDAGAKDLLPEDSYSGETSLIWTHGWLRVQLLAYAQTISQWIQWIPDNDGNYEPRNVKKVAIKGAQVKTTAAATIGDIHIACNVHYQYAESVVKSAPVNEQYSVGKQLIYTPVHTAALTLNVKRKQSRLLVSSQYNSRRFIDPANSDLYALDGYALADISLAHQWVVASHTLDVNIAANNVLDQRYRMFAGRAMPGRNYNVQITYQLNYKSK
jgi:iron complex outermembrane receptor protein